MNLQKLRKNSKNGKINWKAAQAVKYDEAEKQEIIRAKDAEQLQRQENFKESYLLRYSKQVRLNDFANAIQIKINKIDEINKAKLPEEQKKLQLEEQTGQFKMFGGHFSSLRHAKAEFEMERFFYAKAVKAEKYFYEALKKDGLTDDQINGIITEDKYIKSSEITEKDSDKDEKHPDYMG